ncbi:MAG: hypothetical protein QM831_43715 [Kofleriaceae bacterium]
MAKTHPAAQLIEQHAWKARTIEVDGVEYDAIFFDWYDLEAQDEAVIAKGKALPEDQRDDYFSHASLWTGDFEEYFSGDKDEQVEAGLWLPLAVLGMAEGMESFAEMNNDGFLALDLESGKVIRYNQDDDEVQDVGTLDELATQLEIEMD